MIRAAPLIACLLIPALASAESVVPETLVLQGVVREVSGGPGGKARALLRTEAGQKYELRARPPLVAQELLRLSKITIKALVTPLDRSGRLVMVESYEIVALPGGQRPRIGHFATKESKGRKRLMFVDGEGNAVYLPQGWTRKLTRHAGSKVWVLGTPEDGVLRPKRFGILRPALKKTARKSEGGQGLVHAPTPAKIEEDPDNGTTSSDTP
jgi:hypothetical protein